MITKQDYYIAALIGVYTSFLTFFILLFLQIPLHKGLLFLLTIIPILWIAGLWLGKYIGTYIPFFVQFGKYVASGILSSALDLTVLNAASAITGVTAGIIVGWINIPGFIVGVTNAYVFNKYWVFRKNIDMKFTDILTLDRLPRFLSITTVGLVLNSSIVVLLTTLIDTPSTFTSTQWLTLAKIIATSLQVFWNFLGYKFIVFKP
jgi:putative flippase GtrA